MFSSVTVNLDARKCGSPFEKCDRDDKEDGNTSRRVVTSERVRVEGEIDEVEKGRIEIEKEE